MKKYFLLIIILIQFTSIFSDEFGHKILLLYQSSIGQTETENPSNWHIADKIKKYGFSIEFVDIDKKLPLVSDDIYAVIGWLGSNTRNSALELLEWYNNLLDKNIKLILIGAIGCWQEAKTGKYLEDYQVNSLFLRLGVAYKGYWTNQSSILEVVFSENTVYKNGFILPPTIDYFMFKVINDSVKPYLIISRKDIKYSDSVPVFISKNGGFIFTGQYILKDNNFLIDINEFIERALFYSNNEQKILIASPDLEFSKRLIKDFKFTKINTTNISYEKFLKLPLKLYSSYNLIILHKYDFRKENNTFIERINSFVQNGGSLLLLNCEFDERTYSLAGIKNLENDKVLINKKLDFYNLYPDIDKILYLAYSEETKEKEIHYFKLYNLTPDCEVIISGTLKDSLNKKVPIAWRRNYEKGNISIWLYKLCEEKTFISLLLQMAISTMKVSVHFFANIGIMFLDDFPLPTYNIIRNPSPIPGKNDLDDNDFILNHALPGLLTVLKKYEIPLTCFAIFSYDDDIEPPFKNIEMLMGDNNAYKKMLKILLENDVEIGLHGYNHQSLSFSSTITKRWKSINDMINALKVARFNFKNLIGEYFEPFSYVAPMNIIDETGIKALIQVFPSIKVISTLFRPDKDSYETDMDFGIVDGTDILFIPRTSSGFLFDEVFYAEFQKGIWSYGIWPHFLHLDDSYDVKRSKSYSWFELLKSFETQLNYVKKNYPFLRFYKCRDAYYILLDYEQSKYNFYIDKTKKNIEIIIPNNSSIPKFFILTLPKNSKIKNIINGKIEYIFPQNGKILIKTEKIKTTIIYE